MRSINEDIEGWLVAKRYTCHGCRAAALDVDGEPLKHGQHIVVVDESPVGYEPDPKFLPRL